MRNPGLPVFSPQPLFSWRRAMMALALLLAFDVCGGGSIEGGNREDTVAHEDDAVHVHAADDDDVAVSDADGNSLDDNTAHPAWTTTPTALRKTIITARTWMTQMEGQQKLPPSVQNDDDGSEQQPVQSGDDGSGDEDADSDGHEDED